jgi:flagellar export protein FliJ
MNSLETLIKLHRWRLDEQRRRVVELENLVESLRAQMARLDQEQAAEQQIARGSLEASTTYSGYARVLIERRQKLLLSIQETEEETVKARAVLAEAFGEVKRYETAAANRLLAQHRKLERLMQNDMDEIALDGFRRRENK